MIQPQNRVEIRPPFSGRIEEILIEEGDKIKAGQTLAWMSSTDRAALLDTARSEGEETVKYWQEVYKPTPLIAPIDGEIIVRAVEPGQTVTPTDTVLVLSDRLIIKAQVDETDIGKVKLGRHATVGLDAYPDVKVKARVNHIAYESTIVNNVTIYEVDLVPEKVPQIFRSGMSVNVDIVDTIKENVLLLPSHAVRNDGGKNFVLVSQGAADQPLKRKVKTGISDDKNVEIISGLEVADRILVSTKEYVPPKPSNSNGSPLLPGRRH
jgi:macrolide-specific efflux system membrane fusion protein